jgi:hypothetical protein
VARHVEADGGVVCDVDASELIRPRPPAIIGVVRDLSDRVERRGFRRRVERVLTFVIDRQDDAGQVIAELSVEMRGSGFDGVLHEGDRVQLPGGLGAGQTVRVERLQNLTEGVAFHTKGPPISSVIVGIAAFVGVAAVMIVLFLQFLLSSPV